MKGIGVENFRVFKDPAYFEFPGITALIGPNSSGKSSLLKLLKLLKENIKEGKTPDELNFRGSDHFLGNLKISRNRDSGRGDMVISFPQTLFNEFKETSKEIKINFKFIEDFRKKELSNGLLVAVTVTYGDEIVFSLDLTVTDKDSTVKRGDIHPFINANWLATSLHELYDLSLLDHSRAKQHITSSNGKLVFSVINETLIEYVQTVQNKLGYPEVITAEDLKTNESFKCLTGFFTDPFTGQIIIDRLFCKDKKSLETKLKLFEDYNKIDKITLDYLNNSIWPPERFKDLGKLSHGVQFTIFPYPLLDVISTNYLELIKIQSVAKRVEFIEEKLTKKGYDSIFTSAFGSYYKDFLNDALSFSEIVNHFRKKDLEFFELLTNLTTVWHEHFAEDIQSFGAMIAQFGGDYSDALLALKKNLIEIKSSNGIESIELQNTLIGFLESIKNCLRKGLIRPLSSYPKELFESLKAKNSAHDYFYIQHILNDQAQSDSHKSFKKLLSEKIESAFNNSISALLSLIIDKTEVEFISLNSIRGSADRVYSDQDQSTEWRKMVFDLVNIESSKLDFINSWVSNFGIGEKLIIVRGEDAASSRVLIYHKESFRENLSDLGFGISQMLPIICKIALAPSNSFIVLEEPEANLHPAYQSQLADLFVAANEKFGHKFLLETHSEYLVRKLQVLVARGEFDNEKANIYYFNPEGGEEKERLKQIAIGKDGALSGSFGSGFFDESSNWRYELLRINKTQAN